MCSSLSTNEPTVDVNSRYSVFANLSHPRTGWAGSIDYQWSIKLLYFGLPFPKLAPFVLFDVVVLVALHSGAIAYLLKSWNKFNSPEISLAHETGGVPPLWKMVRPISKLLVKPENVRTFIAGRCVIAGAPYAEGRQKFTVVIERAGVGWSRDFYKYLVSPTDIASLAT